LCWNFFKDSVFLYFMVTSVLFYRVADVKGFPIHLIKDVIFSILEDRSALHNCCVYLLYGIFCFFFLGIFNFGRSSIPT
jgi:hypothetical protein